MRQWLCSAHQVSRIKFMTRRVLALTCALLTAAVSVARASDRAEGTTVAANVAGKLDRALLARVESAPSRGARSRVIVRTLDGRPASALIAAVNGIPGRYFAWLGGQVAVVPDAALDHLARRPEVASISLDRPVRGTLDRTATATGARWVNEHLGVTGLGVGIATIDSGVSPWHEDLDGRVAHFADFVNAQMFAYDDYGHGTHVAGIMVGNGRAAAGTDANGAQRGVAPGAHLVVLKALDMTGNGFTSNVIAAIDYAIAKRATYNIRVLNLSVAAGVYESFTTDPLTLAAKRAVDSGIVVVAAAGNRGRDGEGQPQDGGIASPGNAPWVLTVGASNDLGTVDRRDDVVAAFSSRGPAPIDETAKPDLVAPGVNIESTADPSSALFAANPTSRLWGSTMTGSEPYLSLTGTSMAAPVVTGAIALMLEANASLTPNAVKAILEYTAEARTGYTHLTQGAGFLNARGAVELARGFAGVAVLPELSADPVRWSRQIIWGNRRIAGGMLGARANAWQLGVTWGDARTPAGESIAWGASCGDDPNDCRRAPWSTPCNVVTPDCDPSAPVDMPASDSSADLEPYRRRVMAHRLAATTRCAPASWRARKMRSLAGAGRPVPREHGHEDASDSRARLRRRRRRPWRGAAPRLLPRRDVLQPGTVRSLRPAAVPLGHHLHLQGEPAAHPQRFDDVGVVRGRLRVAAAARPERDDARRGGERVQPVHVPHQGAQPAAPDALQHGLPRDHGAGRRRRLSPARRRGRTGRSGDAPQAARRCRDDLLRRQHPGHCHGDRALHQPGGLQDLERELPLERAELLRRRRSLGGGDVDGHRVVGALDHAARGGAALPDLPHLQGVSGPHRGRAASRARDGGPAPGDDRSAGAGDRRQGSDLAVAHPAGAALRRLGRPGAGHVGQRRPGREDRGPAARHRQARGARAHPVQARAADARGVPEDSRPSQGRRRHRQLGAVSLSRGAAHPQPSRAVGRQGLPDRTQGRRDPARRAHPLGRRLLRRADGGAARITRP